MRVLLVEDDENKGVQLRRFVGEAYPEARLELRRSLQSGIRSIRFEFFDLILLDMTLSNYDAGPDEPGGGMTHSFGGREFLKQMDRFDVVTPTVVVTQFETFGKAPHALDLKELDLQLKQRHPRAYVGCVYYHASIRGWREQLKLVCDEALSGAPGAGATDG